MVERNPAPLDAERILRSLAEHRVDYVLIGGLAVQTHGHTRMTNDVDLIPAPDPENLARLADALSDVGSQDGNVNVLHEVPGGVLFEDLRDRALAIDLDGLQIQVASRDDLIRMKLARGRPIDRADVAALTDPGAD